MSYKDNIAPFRIPYTAKVVVGWKVVNKTTGEALILPASLRSADNPLVCTNRTFALEFADFACQVYEFKIVKVVRTPLKTPAMPDIHPTPNRRLFELVEATKAFVSNPTHDNFHTLEESIRSCALKLSDV